MKNLLLRVLLVGVLVVPPVVGVFVVAGLGADRSALEFLRELFLRTARGEVDSRALLEWAAIGLAVIWFGIVWSLVKALRDRRAGRVISGRLGKWLLLLAIGGVTASTAGVVQAKSPDPTDTSLVRVEQIGVGESTAGERLDLTEVVAFSLGVGSALMGAGMAKRIREKQRRHLRSADESSVDVSVNDVAEWPEWGVAENLLERIECAVVASRRMDPSAWIVQVVVRENGDLWLEFQSVPKVVHPFERVSNRIALIRNGIAIETSDDETDARPIMLHIGEAAGGSVWVNLGVVRTFTVEGEGDEGDLVWRALSAGIRLGPWSERISVRGSDHLDVLELRETTESGQASPAVVRRGSFDTADYGLRHHESGWRLMPSDIDIEPVGMTGDEIQRIRALLGESQRPIRVGPRPLAPERVVRHPALPRWSFLASVMGPPVVIHESTGPVDFERSKAQELVIWLALHPKQQRRSLARTALWNAAVKDATFSNITAEVRRALSLVKEPEPEGHWLGITLTDELPLASTIISDSAILKCALEHARTKPEEDGVGALREALDLVRGTPFSGSNYIWPDYIGVSSDVAVMIVRASMLMAEMCREAGDLEGVYWATAKGLLALPGHEELVAIRMRAHADHGDFSGVRTEWDAYCRAIAADEWRPSEPASKLVELWRQLGGRSAADELSNSKK